MLSHALLRSPSCTSAKYLAYDFGKNCSITGCYDTSYFKLLGGGHFSFEDAIPSSLGQFGLKTFFQDIEQSKKVFDLKDKKLSTKFGELHLETDLTPDFGTASSHGPASPPRRIDELIQRWD